MNSILLITIIGVLIIVAGIITFIILNPSNPVDPATLTAAGISTIIVKEPFYEIVVFDSYDKIKNNFEMFINIYLPIFSTNAMNNILKQNYGINKSMQQIISSIKIFNTRQYMWLIYLCILVLLISTRDPRQTYLIGLAMIIINNSEKSNIKGYYLDDYNKMKDFIIYVVPNNFDKTLITSTNDSIKDTFTENGDRIELSPPYKISLKKMKLHFIKNPTKPYTTDRPITSSSSNQINILTQLLYSNMGSFIHISRLMILAPLILNEKPNETKIVEDIINMHKKLSNEVKEFVFIDSKEKLIKLYTDIIKYDLYLKG